MASVKAHGLLLPSLNQAKSCSLSSMSRVSKHFLTHSFFLHCPVSVCLQPSLISRSLPPGALQLLPPDTPRPEALRRERRGLQLNSTFYVSQTQVSKIKEPKYTAAAVAHRKS